MRDGGELVYVALGANLGHRDATFAATLRALDAESDLLLVSASPIFETDPVGPDGQGAYLNAVVQLHVWLGPIELLGRLQAIEVSLGRDRSRETVRWGPREIDLDIVFFGDRCIEMPDLVVPHARAHERSFVMAPMAVLAPAFVHPKLGRTMTEIARSFSDSDRVRAWPSPTGWPGARADEKPSS
jgi:2-amino-4-hydroxy-6-hydroxymethyldihydropteridine diphosphokinase